MHRLPHLQRLIQRLLGIALPASKPQPYRGGEIGQAMQDAIRRVLQMHNLSPPDLRLNSPEWIDRLIGALEETETSECVIAGPPARDSPSQARWTSWAECLSQMTIFDVTNKQHKNGQERFYEPRSIPPAVIDASPEHRPSPSGIGTRSA